MRKLAGVAASQPHAAFAAFTQCLQGQWTFLSRTMLDSSDLFRPLEDSIRKDFIRALFKRDVNDLERDMLSLPARMGGMGIFKPAEECLVSSANSMCISAPLVRLIQRQAFELDPRELAEEMKMLRAGVDRESDLRFKTKREVILEHAPAELRRAVIAASEKGASSWVTASPSYDHGTVLHKRLRRRVLYGWTLLDLPISCACGTAFNLQHALDCKLGGFRIIQHNEVRDTIAQFMREAGHIAVELEPQLQPLTGRSLSTSRLTRTTKRAATSNAAGSGATCDRRISILRWCHLLPEAMFIWNLHSCSRTLNAPRYGSTRNVFSMSSMLTSTPWSSPPAGVCHLRVTSC